MPKYTADKVEIPISMKNMIRKLFGEKSKFFLKKSLTDSELKQLLRKILTEYSEYLEENIETDQIHKLMLYSGILQAEYVIKNEKDYWISLVEALFRIMFIMIGEMPEHPNKVGGRKRNEHYSLKKLRNINYNQDAAQKFRTLFVAKRLRVIVFDKDPEEAIWEFRNLRTKFSHKSFFVWYKRNYPNDYAKIF